MTLTLEYLKSRKVWPDKIWLGCFQSTWRTTNPKQCKQTFSEDKDIWSSTAEVQSERGEELWDRVSGTDSDSEASEPSQCCGIHSEPSWAGCCLNGNFCRSHLLSPVPSHPTVLWIEVKRPRFLLLVCFSGLGVDCQSSWQWQQGLIDWMEQVAMRLHQRPSR